MPTTLLLDKEEMTRILERLACEVLERHGQCERVMLVGIERRGADLARRLGALMQQKLQRPLPLGTLDINLYRDDWTSLEGKPHIGQSRITAPVDNAEIILIDDVLFSGDTLFCRSIGRTDLAGGDFRTIMESIKKKLFLLPDETQVLPGHMGPTTIGFEKENNPFV